MQAQEAGVEAAAEAARRGYKLDTVKGQLLADGLALRKAYWKVIVEPYINAYDVTTQETNKAWDELEDAIRRGEDPGRIAGAYATLKGFFKGLDHAFNGPAIRDLCREIGKGGPFDWIKEKVLNAPKDDPTIPNILKNWRDCHLAEALRLAELAKAQNLDAFGVDKILPHLRANAEVEARVDLLLQQAVATSDPAQARKLLDEAAAAAKGVPCLAERVAKLKPPAPQPGAPAAGAECSGPHELWAWCPGRQRRVCIDRRTMTFDSLGAVVLPQCNSPAPSAAKMEVLPPIAAPIPVAPPEEIALADPDPEPPVELALADPSPPRPPPHQPQPRPPIVDRWDPPMPPPHQPQARPPIVDRWDPPMPPPHQPQHGRRSSIAGIRHTRHRWCRGRRSSIRARDRPVRKPERERCPAAPATPSAA